MSLEKIVPNVVYICTGFFEILPRGGDQCSSMKQWVGMGVESSPRSPLSLSLSHN